MATRKNLEEQSKEVEIGLGVRQAKRIDFESWRVDADIDVCSLEELGEIFKTAAQVEDECVGIVFLEIGDEKIQKERLARAGPS